MVQVVVVVRPGLRWALAALEAWVGVDGAARALVVVVVVAPEVMLPTTSLAAQE